MSADEIRKMVDRALKDLRASNDPDTRLSLLQKISQLAENATDEELYELASVISVEEDPRLRGEICYTIERSRRPELVHFVEKMVQDENPYVRRQAITAISGLNGINDAVLKAIELLISAVNELKSAVANLENDLSSVRGIIEKRKAGEGFDTAFSSEARADIYAHAPTTSDFIVRRAMNGPIKLADTLAESSPRDGIIMDERMKCWEAYLRNEKELLQNHKGKYVALYKGEIVGIDESDENLAKMIYEKYGAVEALICKVVEENREPIQMPPYDRNIVE